MIADLKPYTEYRESGLPWLGQVPGHWAIRRVKFLLREVDSRSTTGKEQLLRVSQYTGVTQRKSINGSDEPDSRAASLVGYKRVGINDLVINIMLAWNGSLGASKYEGITSPAYCVYRFNKDTLPWYYQELLRLPSYKGRIKIASAGVVESRLRLYSDDLGRIEAILPPPEEQAAIVRFLDWTNGRLERTIRAKRKVITLLTEQKQAIIHRAVTRGLDPSVPLKPSGIPWLGDIPQHWDVRKLKNLKSRAKHSFVDGPFGSSLKSIHYVPNGYAYVVESGFITSGEFKWKEFKTITKEHFHTIERSSCSVDDIVIAKIGANYGMAGILPALMRPAVVSGNSLKLTVDNAIASNRFVHVALLSARAGGALDLIVNATAQPALSLGTMNNLSLPMPPRNEQDEILKHIRDATKKLINAIDRTQREIELLREYRTRLVADVVTGKLDVREAAVRLPEEATFDVAEASDETEPTDEEIAV